MTVRSTVFETQNPIREDFNSLEHAQPSKWFVCTTRPETKDRVFGREGQSMMNSIFDWSVGVGPLQKTTN